MKRRVVVILLGSGGLTCAATALVGYRIGIARADMPPDTKALAYSGMLEDGNGVVTSASLLMQVKLFPEDSGGSSPAVCATDPALGYKVTLGRFSIPLPDACVEAVKTHGELYAEMTVAGDPPMPRTILRAVPYAVQAGAAHSANQAGHASTSEAAQRVANPWCASQPCGGAGVDIKLVEGAPKDVSAGTNGAVGATCPLSHPIPVSGGCWAGDSRLVLLEFWQSNWDNPQKWSSATATERASWYCNYQNNIATPLKAKATIHCRR